MKKALFRILFLLPLASFCLFPSPEGYGQERVLIKFAALAPEGSTWMKHMRRLESNLKKMSGGVLVFRIYPGGIAGDELDVLRKIRIGQIHCAAFSGVGFGQILPMVRVLDLPFLFRSHEEVDLVHRQLEDFFREEFRKADFELLSWAEVGNVHLFSRKPIRRVADLSGLKIWTWTGDPISQATFSSMGVTPIPLSVTDVTTALNTGMIDTVYAPPLGALALQWHRYTKCMSAMPLAHSTGAVLFSGSYFRKIPPELARMLRDAFQGAMQDLTLDLRRQTKEAVRMIEQSGLQILPMPTQEDLEDFYRIHDQVAGHLVGKVYSRDILDRVYAVLAKKRDSDRPPREKKP
ncbi:MAG: TRAP transporter substrate-binding protein DctP [Deltaproteobacteria bacterium]|nr:TRAP transporter substrate-binding protein DctP [Deltaproteobacteria bacterium]